MHATAPEQNQSQQVRTYLHLMRLLDGIGQDHPEVSAPLRLILLRARRDGQLAALDQNRFHAAAARYDRRVNEQQMLIPAVP